jgi:hypothetical protein
MAAAARARLSSGAIVQMSLTGALRLAPVAVVIPMDYSALLWSIAAAGGSLAPCPPTRRGSARR